MVHIEESENALDKEQQEMWEQLDKEVTDLIEGGALHQAMAKLTTAIDSAGADREKGILRARMLTRRAELFLDLDDGDSALEDAEKAISLGLRDASSYGAAGWASYQLDKPEKAREYFDRALRDDPGDVAVLTGRALVLMDLDEFEHARSDLSRALQEDPGSEELLSIRGEVYLRMGDLDGAARDLEAAVESSPDDPEYALSLARLYLVRGDIEGALKVVATAVDEGEDFILEAILLRSHLRLLAGQGSAARSDAIRASNLYPDEAFAFVQLAHVELAEGNLNLAKKAAERAVLLDPSLSDAYMVRGAAYQMEGREEESRSDFERASRADVELPVFLLGPAHEVFEDRAFGFDASVWEKIAGKSTGFDPSSFAEAFGGFGQGGPGSMPGGINPMNMLDQIFDNSGSIRGPLKPFFEMAFKNAPKIMQNLPPEFLAGQELDGVDISELSSEEIEERMREFYQLMKSGKNPFDPGDDDSSGGDES